MRLDVVYDGELPNRMPNDWHRRLNKIVSKRVLEQIDAAFAAIKTGDALQFGYLPQTKESILLLNQTVRLEVQGNGLYEAVKAIWLGDDPVLPHLKTSILAGSCSA